MAGTSGSSVGVVGVSDQGSGISVTERALRRKDADRARHSIEMEGGSVSAPAQANIDRYVAGEIDIDQLKAVEAARLERDIAAQAGG